MRNDIKKSILDEEAITSNNWSADCSLQSSLANSITLWDVKPDLIFIFVYALGLIYNEEKAMLMGAGLGFVSDVFSGGPLGA